MGACLFLFRCVAQDNSCLHSTIYIESDLGVFSGSACAHGFRQRYGISWYLLFAVTRTIQRR